MRTISKEFLGESLISLLDEPCPVENDIGILGPSGELAGVIISGGLYRFLLEKLEEEQDRIDNEIIDQFHQSEEADK